MPRQRGRQYRGRPAPTAGDVLATPAPRKSAVPVRCGRPGCGRPMATLDHRDAYRGAVGNVRDGIGHTGSARVFTCREHGPHPAVSARRLHRLWHAARLPVVIGEPARAIVL